MNRHISWTQLLIVWLFLFFWCSSIYTQETPGKGKPSPVERDWTEVCWDIKGLVRFRLSEPPYVWRFTKETILKGRDAKDRFPQYRYTYKLNPGNQSDAIDLTPLDDKNGDEAKTKPKKILGIYFVKDDYLMICVGRDSRPKSFSSSKDNHNWLYILRRGKLKTPVPATPKPARKRCQEPF